ncbi:MAG: hypothetical protein NZO16_07865, partial [Deltaproteobacteria bacterium]|nr:hypothetical protein [Deltaproteobacteria bacterium]
MEVGSNLRNCDFTWCHQNFPFFDEHKRAGGGSEIVTKKDAIFILVTDEQGNFGIGEASFVTVPGRVEPNIQKELESLKAFNSSAMVDERAIYNLSPRLRYALSMAQADLIAKKKGVPLWAYLRQLLRDHGI